MQKIDSTRINGSNNRVRHTYNAVRVTIPRIRSSCISRRMRCDTISLSFGLSFLQISCMATAFNKWWCLTTTTVLLWKVILSGFTQHRFIFKSKTAIANVRSQFASSKINRENSTAFWKRTENVTDYHCFHSIFDLNRTANSQQPIPRKICFEVHKSVSRMTPLHFETEWWTI